MAEGKMVEGILAKRGKWRGENDEGKMARGNWQRGNCHFRNFKAENHETFQQKRRNCFTLFLDITIYFVYRVDHKVVALGANKKTFFVIARFSKN
jgi:hypothetical protein